MLKPTSIALKHLHLLRELQSVSSEVSEVERRGCRGAAAAAASLQLCAACGCLLGDLEHLVACVRKFQLCKLAFQLLH